MELRRAIVLSSEVVEKIRDCCKKIKVCGSIRRRKVIVNDIDIVCIPNSYRELLRRVESFAERFLAKGTKVIRFIYKNEQIDLYIANDFNFEVLVLIRTGSRVFNVELIKRAKKLGYRFTMEKGLVKGEEVINKEREIIEKVFGYYIKPEDRSWGK